MKHNANIIGAGMAAIYSLERLFFFLTGCRGRVLREVWRRQGERVQFLLNLQHGTKIEYGRIAE